MNQKKAGIQFLAYYVEKVMFEINNSKIKTSEKSIKINYDFKKKSTYIDNKLELTIISNIFKDNKEAPFSILVRFKGIFKFEKINESEKVKYEKNAIAILFPYLRTFITNLTVNAGFKPILIPVYDFTDSFFEEEKE